MLGFITKKDIKVIKDDIISAEKSTNEQYKEEMERLSDLLNDALWIITAVAEEEAEFYL